MMKSPPKVNVKRNLKAGLWLLAETYKAGFHHAAPGVSQNASRGFFYGEI